MLEKVLPIIIAVIAMQFLIRFMQKKRSQNKTVPRDYDYKKKIDQFMKVSNYDEGAGSDRILADEIRSGLGKPDLLLGIPDSMRETRKELNLIIDGVTHGVRSKIGKNPVIEVKYKDPVRMFDEIVEIIKKHKLS